MMIENGTCCEPFSKYNIIMHVHVHIMLKCVNIFYDDLYAHVQVYNIGVHKLEAQAILHLICYNIILRLSFADQISIYIKSACDRV